MGYQDKTDLSVVVAKIDRDSPAEDIVYSYHFWGRRVDKEVLAAIPRGEGKESTITFVDLDKIFREIGQWEISLDELEQRYAEKGFRFADPRAYLAMHVKDANFANNYSTTTFWKHNGRWCCAAAGRSCGIRYTHIVYYNDPGKECRLESPVFERIALEPL